ncbi:hypothetical protein MICRO8M_80268 [Microbacterium sp. 8M]|nr:hypothetical protein MICRO8M_80268 [Microbacterium sp. 8M]
MVKRIRSKGDEDSYRPGVSQGLASDEDLLLERGLMLINIVEDDNEVHPASCLEMSKCALSVRKSVGEVTLEHFYLLECINIGIRFFQVSVDALFEIGNLPLVDSTYERPLTNVKV